jgi:hypothetical protein
MRASPALFDPKMLDVLDRRWKAAGDNKVVAG